MVKRLILVRHGSVRANRQGRFVGGLDLPLDRDGVAEALRVARFLESRSIQGIFCSPLQRCVATARAIVESRRLPLQICEDLQEIDFGAWENRNFQEVSRAHPEAVRQWAENYSVFQFPDGENVADFNNRVGRALGSLLANQAETMVAVTHGGVIRTMLCQLLKIPGRCSLAFRINPGSLVEFEISGNTGVLLGLRNLSGSAEPWPDG